MKQLRSFFSLLVFLIMAWVSVAAQVTVDGLTIENRIDPVGIDASIPRFSWKIRSDARNEMQSAYELKVVQGKKIVWQSGKVASSRSLYIPYGGDKLASASKYEWQVRVWGQDGKPSLWSASAYFYTGILSSSEWKAQWIESGQDQEDPQRPALYVRKTFGVSRSLKPTSVQAWVATDSKSPWSPATTNWW
mgnify:CR=1 FL=1